jgi:uncharacterized membrane protein
MNNNNENVIVNKETILTTSKVYEQIYYNQLIEITKLAFSFLITGLSAKLIDALILDRYKDNKVIYIILLIILLFSTIIIGVKIFTYAKIVNENEQFLEKLTNIN